MNRLNLRIFLIILFFSTNLNPLTVGSDTAVSRLYSTPVFLSGDTLNNIVGFTKLESGFSLETSDVTCTFDAFFPVSGSILLNSGSLF